MRPFTVYKTVRLLNIAYNLKSRISILESKVQLEQQTRQCLSSLERSNSVNLSNDLGLQTDPTIKVGWISLVRAWRRRRLLPLVRLCIVWSGVRNGTGRGSVRSG